MEAPSGTGGHKGRPYGKSGSVGVGAHCICARVGSCDTGTGGYIIRPYRVRQNSLNIQIHHVFGLFLDEFLAGLHFFAH